MQLLQIHAELPFSYDDTQVFNLFLFEGAFLRFDVEVAFCEDVEYLMDLLLMSCYVLFFGFVRPLFGMDDPVVHED